MTNRLTEQQLQEELLDEIGDFTKAPQPKAPQTKAQAQAQPQAQPQGQTKTKPTGVLKNLADEGIHIPTGNKEDGPAEDAHMILDHLVGAYLMRIVNDK